MFKEIFLFEIKYRLKRPSTYVYFGIWFGLVLLMATISEPTGTMGGRVFRNSPYQNFKLISNIMGFGTIIISAIFGTSILRDFQEGMYELFFTKPIRKLSYLGGRLLGSAVISVLVFSGLVFGLLVSTIMPWVDKTAFMPVHLWFYIQPFLLIGVTNILFAGALFFAIGALTRNIVVVYLQGIVFYLTNLVARNLANTTPDSVRSFLPALLDPLGIQTGDLVTRYWTIAEKNSLIIPFAGIMAYNRLLWLCIGATALIIMFRYFPWSVEVLAGKGLSRKHVSIPEEAATASPVWTLGPILLDFSLRAKYAQFLRLTRLRTMNTIMSMPFLALTLIILVVCFLSGYSPRLADTPVFPATYLMAGRMGALVIFFIAITTIYAGEMVWKERELRFDQIHDALPVPMYLSFASMLSALTVISMALSFVIILAGIIMQASHGYFRFEFPVYFKEIVLVRLPCVIQYAVAALLVHKLLRNKFLGHAIIIGIVLLSNILIPEFGYINYLYRFGEVPSYVYSDMNGYGHFAKPIFWFVTYWTLFAAVLAVAAIVLTPRGTDQSWGSRLRLARAHFRFPLNVAGFICAAAFVAVGGFIFYNTHILNKYEDDKAQQNKRVRYEQLYRKYDGLPQPKIQAIELNVDIFPERRAFQASGSMTLVNKTGQSVAAIHIRDDRQALQKLDFDRPFKEIHADKDIGYYICELAESLQPGTAVTLKFTTGYTYKGFLNNGERPEFAHNGTFFDREYFPAIGYSRDNELTDDDLRRKQKLSPRADMPLPDDAKAGNIKLFSPDANLVTFKATVSTSPDQIALAPGYLEREWTENGRRYFSYDMGSTRIKNSYSFISGRYTVKRDRWNDVAIEVYYDPHHEYNVARMIESVKKGLEYFTRNFGPYQFRQFRILEFPRYRSFAQSFPNTVPYSEGMGFIAHARKEEDLDVPFYVTAHELAHQWWGHQVTGRYAQGSNMLSETLAQYAALMVMEKEVGHQNIRNYLKHELDRYLKGRSSERKKEPPLYLSSTQQYVYYYKGSLIMYALKDYIGEERLNAALRKYLEAAKFQDAPYTNSIEFLKYIREATPENLQYLVTDLFEKITLYDNRAVEASYRETADHKYEVDLKVAAKKLHADELGAEKELPLNDMVDIGIFAGEGKNRKALFLGKRRITHAQEAFKITVDQKPSHSGIDPYNKLVDRLPNDNVIAVTKLRY